MVHQKTVATIRKSWEVSSKTTKWVQASKLVEVEEVVIERAQLHKAVLPLPGDQWQVSYNIFLYSMSVAYI